MLDTTESCVEVNENHLFVHFKFLGETSDAETQYSRWSFDITDEAVFPTHNDNSLKKNDLSELMQDNVSLQSTAEMPELPEENKSSQSSVEWPELSQSESRTFDKSNEVKHYGYPTKIDVYDCKYIGDLLDEDDFRDPELEMFCIYQLRMEDVLKDLDDFAVAAGTTRGNIKSQSKLGKFVCLYDGCKYFQTFKGILNMKNVSAHFRNCHGAEYLRQ